ncbi:glycosyltransferase family 2 protein [Anaerorhabdus sp.]|uniref:glycosyltransferase family 2 protein n=1 Tax=Anaerorhabdus sp. TaxID=1872524 RepID=UPI002B2115AF|nr:glycosyltransferase family 2 protein [Anaerorhabdus sp.]MEA4876109.1 glycosyltransferase family 2 protein [Anaerorhabdus sp.]
MKIAILVPCYNEELTVEKVVFDFKSACPDANIYVYDNNSKDKTNELALKAGAIVRNEYRQGKGNVVRSMFRDIDADVYVLVDGDDTYPADEVQKLINPIINQNADMVIGDRLSNGTYFKENKRGFHGFGNNLVRNLINSLFKSNIKDIMTGYRAYSKKFVKCMPIMSEGFQIETEMTIFSLVYGMNVVEVPITYRDRPVGSESKLNTVSDGIKVLVTLFDLFKNYRPFLFFGILSLLFSLMGLIVGLPVIIEFIETAFITKVPSAILAASLFVIAFILFVVGIILDSQKNQTQLLFQMHVNEFIRNAGK